MSKKLKVEGTEIVLFRQKGEDYISVTDIARHKDKERSDYILQNWMRRRNTIEFLGLWEKINNINFNPINFDGIRIKSGLNSFSLTPKRWIKETGAIGIISKTGRYYGGTFAHKDIAFEFASWISPEFKLFLIKEFQRLKEEENKRLSIDWDLRRNLAKINYKIHTDAIKEHLIPKKLTKEGINILYASEADVLNKALFNMTAKEWAERNPNKKGNIRDFATVTQLVCLSNLESLNAEFIRQKLPQRERLVRLNEIAIIQMKSLVGFSAIKKLKSNN